MGKVKGIVLTLSLVIALVFTGSVFANAKTGEVAIKVGEAKTVKTSLKNASWATSDKAIAKVSQKGKITGVKQGECFVVAVANGKADVFKVTVTKKVKKNSYLGTWIADEIEGIKMADLKKQLVDSGFVPADQADSMDIYLEVTNSTATMIMAGESSSIDIIPTDNGFKADDNGTLMTAVFNAKNGTLILEENGEVVIFVRP